MRKSSSDQFQHSKVLKFLADFLWAKLIGVPQWPSSFITFANFQIGCQDQFYRLDNSIFQQNFAHWVSGQQELR